MSNEPVSVTSVVTAAKADISVATTELSFVKANWGKLSAIVIAAAAAGALVGHIL